jgi:hypothetical protein
MTVGAHGAYLNGWRNASPALARGNGEHELARGPDVTYDDLGDAGIAIPLERDRVTIVVTCVEFHKRGLGRVDFHKHERLLSGGAARSG